MTTIGGAGLVRFVGWEYYLGSDHAAFPVYFLRSWTTLSQGVIAAFTSFIVWFYSLATNVQNITIYYQYGMKGAWFITCWSAGLTAGYVISIFALIRPKHIKLHIIGSAWLNMIFLSCLAVAELARSIG